MWEALSNLHDVPWRVVPVNMMHDKLATLFPTIRGSSTRIAAHFTVANDVFAHILGMGRGSL